MKSVAQLLDEWDWRAIRNCPGRYVLRGGARAQDADELFGIRARPRCFRLDSVRDEVIVMRLVGGGLISYRNKSGTYVHTIADDGGFERKLEDLGIGDCIEDKKTELWEGE